MMTSALTTSDNPYSPFDEWDLWYQYDESHGYHSCQLLARIARTSIGLPAEENERSIEEAIDFIISYIPLHSHDGSDFYVKAIKNKTKFPMQS